MPFATNHIQPAGFIAGANLKDGSSFGIVKGKAGVNDVFYDIRLRSIKGTLIAEVAQANTQAGLATASFQAKQAQFLINVKNDQVKDVPALTGLTLLVANAAAMTAVGVSDNTALPTATNVLIGYKQDADGNVTTAALVGDPLNPVAPVNTGTGTGTGTKTGTATGVDALKNLSMTTKILIGVGVAVVIGGVIYFVMKMRKKGKKK